MINLAKANAAKRSGYKHKTPIDHWREDPESLRKSINAKCYDCCHGATDEVKHCTVTACPLWFVRPYQEKPLVKSYCGGKPNYCTPDVDAVNMSQERVDETVKREHEEKNSG